jgi:hypothetical protein
MPQTDTLLPREGFRIKRRPEAHPALRRIPGPLDETTFHSGRLAPVRNSTGMNIYGSREALRDQSKRQPSLPGPAGAVMLPIALELGSPCRMNSGIRQIPARPGDAGCHRLDNRNRDGSKEDHMDGAALIKQHAHQPNNKECSRDNPKHFNLSIPRHL